MLYNNNCKFSQTIHCLLTHLFQLYFQNHYILLLLELMFGSLNLRLSVFMVNRFGKYYIQLDCPTYIFEFTIAYWYFLIGTNYAKCLPIREYVYYIYMIWSKFNLIVNNFNKERIFYMHYGCGRIINEKYTNLAFNIFIFITNKMLKRLNIWFYIVTRQHDIINDTKFQKLSNYSSYKVLLNNIINKIEHIF